jgi:hypothetical protein
MNYFWLIAGLLGLVALGAHALIGDRELRLFRPTTEGTPLSKWRMARAGWHLVSADLLVSNSLLVGLGLGYWATFTPVAGLLALLYAAYGLTWLITLLVSRAPRRDYLANGQWLFLVLESALIACGYL